MRKSQWLIEALQELQYFKAYQFGQSNFDIVTSLRSSDEYSSLCILMDFGFSLRKCSL